MRFVCDSCRASYRISDDKVGPKGVKVRCQKCGFVILVRRPDEEPDEALMTQVMSNPLAPMDALEEGEASLSETPAPGESLGDDLDAAFSFGDDAPETEAPREEQVTAAEQPAPSEPRTEPAASPEGGLDPNALFGDDDEDEIGAIFDSVLNSGSHSLPGTEDDPTQVATRTMDVASMARAMDQSVSADESEKHELTPALPSNEWFVAIEENQVGPVGIDVLKEHWDRGEIGPDSLCWRAGMADWIPLSEVTELQRHLAPKPSKPSIVSPSPSPASVVAAGGVAAASGAPEAGAAGGWKPSAASALASLVKDELDVISRPAPAKKAETGSGLLDVPPVASEPVSSPGAPAASVSMNLPLSATPSPEPFAAAQVPAAPAPYADIPPYQSLPPVQQKKPMGMWIGAGALVVLLLGGAFFLLGRSGGGEVPQVAAAPAQQAPESVPQAVAQADAEKKAAEEAAAKKAQEEAEKAALAKAEEEKKAAEEAAAKKAEEEAALAAAEEEEEKEERTVARRSTRRRTTTRATASSRTTTASRTPTTTAPSRSSGSSDPFDDIFGPSGDSGAKSPRENSRPATYVPPAPSSVPAELSSSDIAQAVVAKRNQLNSCVQKAKAADPGLGSGRMAMRWTIETSGKVSGLSNQTSEIRGSQLDKCVSGVIQSITFPRHRKSGGQVVTFPITF